MKDKYEIFKALRALGLYKAKKHSTPSDNSIYIAICKHERVNPGLNKKEDQVRYCEEWFRSRYQQKRSAESAPRPAPVYKHKPIVKGAPPPKAPPAKPEWGFYGTPEWRALRYQVLKDHHGACELCGATAKSSGKPLHVDHIKPRSLYPHLELDPSNLQVLCEDCNLGKSNKDSIDWRKQPGPLDPEAAQRKAEFLLEEWAAEDYEEEFQEWLKEVLSRPREIEPLDPRLDEENIGGDCPGPGRGPNNSCEVRGAAEFQGNLHYASYNTNWCRSLARH